MADSPEIPDWLTGEMQANFKRWHAAPVASMLEMSAKMIEVHGAAVSVSDAGRLTSVPVAPWRRERFAQLLRARAVRLRADRRRRVAPVLARRISHARSRPSGGRPGRRAGRRSGSPPSGGSDDHPPAPALGRRQIFICEVAR